MQFLPARICLPDLGRIDPEKWAVIACDQFTSEPAYWEACRAQVGEAPSALDLILPEVYLTGDDGARIAAIRARMEAYDGTVLHGSAAPRYVYVERTQPDGRVRAGLLGCIDLEDYDYRPDARCAVRATEGTVLSRIPPRVAIRRGALFELPHVMLLCDDPADDLLSPYAGGRGLSPLYATPLMAGGGFLRGWEVPAAEQDRIEGILDALAPEGSDAFPLAVGDGNHSLAAAKALYLEQKAADPARAAVSPARYALVEVVNLHSPALDFAPIFRLVTGCRPAEVVQDFARWAEAVAADPAHADGPTQAVTFVRGTHRETLTLPHGTHPLTVGTVQAFLDSRPELCVDYVHDEESLAALAQADGTLGILFDGMAKEDLFPAVAAGGPLPRKAFSMGHARDKRYYMEARKLR